MFSFKSLLANSTSTRKSPKKRTLILKRRRVDQGNSDIDQQEIDEEIISDNNIPYIRS